MCIYKKIIFASIKISYKNTSYLSWRQSFIPPNYNLSIKVKITDLSVFCTFLKYMYFINREQKWFAGMCFLYLLVEKLCHKEAHFLSTTPPFPCFFCKCFFTDIFTFSNDIFIFSKDIFIWVCYIFLQIYLYFSQIYLFGYLYLCLNI